MSRTFYPRKVIIVPASSPHPDGTEYKVSVGDEEWTDGEFKRVIKVQIAYDGKVAGRKSPSYPTDTDDWERVNEAVKELKMKYC